MSDYEARLLANEKQNDEYLSIFKNELIEKGLSAKTIREHVSNVDLLLNHYLPGYEEDYQMADGMNSLYGFFVLHCQPRSAFIFFENVKQPSEISTAAQPATTSRGMKNPFAVKSSDIAALALRVQ